MIYRRVWLDDHVPRTISWRTDDESSSPCDASEFGHRGLFKHPSLCDVCIGDPFYLPDSSWFIPVGYKRIGILKANSWWQNMFHHFPQIWTCEGLPSSRLRGMIFAISLTLANPHHFADADDPLLVYEFLVWHGFQLEKRGTDERISRAEPRISCFFSWLSLMQKYVKSAGYAR